MKTINFHHILTNISNLFWQFINTPPDLHVQKISSYPGYTLHKGNAPLKSLDQRYGQKYLTISCFDLTLISNTCSKITYSLGLLVQINKRNLFKLILYGPFFVICIIFHYVLLDILYLTDTAKLPFIMGLVFYICLSFDIFHLAIFLCHVNICIVKQMYINFSVLSTPVKLIISLWDCVCMGVHSSVNMLFFFVFFCLFFCHLFISLTIYDGTEDCVAGLVDWMTSWSFTNPFWHMKQ